MGKLVDTDLTLSSFLVLLVGRGQECVGLVNINIKFSKRTCRVEAVTFYILTGTTLPKSWFSPFWCCWLVAGRSGLVQVNINIKFSKRTRRVEAVTFYILTGATLPKSWFSPFGCCWWVAWRSRLTLV